MDIWLTFAYISEGVVRNTASYLFTGYTEANQHAKEYCRDPEAIAIDVTHIPVQIGDRYSNGVFTRDGREIEALPTQQQVIDELQAQLTEVSAELAEAILELGGEANE